MPHAGGGQIGSHHHQSVDTTASIAQQERVVVPIAEFRRRYRAQEFERILRRRLTRLDHAQVLGAFCVERRDGRQIGFHGLDGDIGAKGKELPRWGAIHHSACHSAAGRRQ
jgi:hypothetical protein